MELLRRKQGEWLVARRGGVGFSPRSRPVQARARRDRLGWQTRQDRVGEVNYDGRLKLL